jgi:hypothetical protein
MFVKKHLEIFLNLVCELGELPVIKGLRFYKNNFQKGKNLLNKFFQTFISFSQITFAFEISQALI